MSDRHVPHRQGAPQLKRTSPLAGRCCGLAIFFVLEIIIPDAMGTVVGRLGTERLRFQQVGAIARSEVAGRGACDCSVEHREEGKDNLGKAKATAGGLLQGSVCISHCMCCSAT